MHSCHGHSGSDASHSHTHGASSGTRLLVSLVTTALFVAGEAAAGFLGHSLALLSDAGHNLGDAVALGLAAYAIWIARKPANERNTYGYHRVAILTALFNAVCLIVIAGGILVESYLLFQKPTVPSGTLMIWVAAVSVMMNTFIAWALSGGAKESLNMRAAFIHMAGDAASASAVIVAGLLVNLTGWQYADPVVAILIALFILYTAWGTTVDAVNILLERTPKGLELDKLIEAMKACAPVIAVHDVHVWTVSDGMHYLSCHVELPDSVDLEGCGRVIFELDEMLARDFGIAHATIQPEIEGTCESADSPPIYCQTPVRRSAHQS